MAAELFVGPIVEKLIDVGFQYLKGQCRWQTGMKKELESLRDNYDNFKAVDFASIRAQSRDENSDFNNWLWQLRDAIDEADDVLDEFEYMNHERQLMKNKKRRKVRFIMKFIKSRLVKIVKRALQIDIDFKRLEEVVKKLDNVLAGVGSLQNLLQIRKEDQKKQLQQLNQVRQAGPLPTNDLIGRKKEKEFVIQWLKKPTNEHQSTSYRNISLLSILGQGGMGKTTLVQHVLSEITNDYDLKIWVCVPINFDEQKVIADMLEYIRKKRPRAESLGSLGSLQESLKSEVISKKFILVMDDVWAVGEEESDKSKWKNVFAPLACGSLGSKILITTRMYSVASMIATLLNKKEWETILKLKSLEEYTCLKLLNSHAFAGVDNSDDHEHLKSITGQIVKKLLGSPLAAKVIGGALNESLDKKHWLNILNSDLMHAKPDQSILSVLRLSYIFLPKHLQNCFAFCCIFAQDHEFDKNDLVRMWIALGFIQPSSYNQERTLEDVGGEYFDILVRKSFFDKFKDYSKTYYKMHDLLHELAQSISAEECFRIMSDKEFHSRIPETIRHLCIESENVGMLKKIGQFKHLHSLFLEIDMDEKESFDTLTEIFKSLRRIRLLYIKSNGLKEIPGEIGNLIHLRYLKFDVVNVTQLPRSLSKLYHLQFIIYYNLIFPRLPNDFLPRDMNNLSNLHYLNLPWDDFPGMNGIGKLNSLQELNGFYVKKEADYTIKELECMNELRQLRITHLENVKDAEQARNAKLCDKKNLTDLSLQWRGDIIFRRNFANNFVPLVERVLENLQPHSSLKKLRMYSYFGIRSAEWMNDANLVSNLEWIKLDNCLEWQTLPPFGELPSLKSLYLVDMPKVKRLDGQFLSLEVLHIRRLEALEDLFDAAAIDVCLFPSLTELCLEDCPKSKELPYLPPKLKLLQLVNVGWKTLNFCSMLISIPLERLEVCGCRNLSCIPLAVEITRLVALKSLTIMDCHRLKSLGRNKEVGTSENYELLLNDLSISDPSVLLMEALRSVTSLRRLCISGNDKLVSFPYKEVERWFPQVSASLCELEFTRLKSLKSLPSSLESFTSLKILNLFDIPELQFLPDLPVSLEQLTLYILKSLLCLPSSLSSMSALKSLRLSYIPLLESLPDLPPSLEHLFIFGCHKELKELYDSTSGVDRIPRVSI